MDLLRWGEHNLTALQQGSATQARVAQRLSQLNCGEWARRCAEASTRPPSWLDRLRVEGDTPVFFEGKLRQLQTEMTPMLKQLQELRDELEPDLLDLRLDAAVLGAYAASVSDATRQQLVSNRLRTLVTGQQGVAMLMQALETTRQTLIQNIQNIDQLLTVTLPAWRAASSTR